MRHGQLVEIGTAEEVLTRPKADYTRELLEAVPRLQPRAPRTNLGEPALSARGVARTFRTRTLFGKLREVRALDRVDIAIRRGETLGLVGESGSGKSTLAQCVIRLERPDEGTLAIAGSDFTNLEGPTLRAARKCVQIVFQDPYTALDPRQTAGGAIAEGPIIHGLARPDARRRATELLQAVGLDASAAERFPHEFSGAASADLHRPCARRGAGPAYR
nr:ATP-binding cassette domain-containing protein [uncultured Jannaschia sp.]